MKSKSIKLSLIEFLGTFYENRLPKIKALAIVKDIMQECELAENDESINDEEIVFKDKGNIYKIYCNSPKDKRSSNFINSVDDDSPRRQSETDKIREIIFNKIIADGFSLIGSIAYYLKKNLESIEDDKGDLNNDTKTFIDAFCEDVVSDSERNREFINYITVLDNYEKCAWVFVFLCFPKEVSSQNTDFRNELIDKLIQAQEFSMEMKVTDITCNSNRIGKINASDIGRKDKISEIKKAVLNNKTVVVQGIGGIGKSYICKKIFWDYHDNYADDIKHLAWIQYNDNLNQSLINAFSFDNNYSIDSELSVFYSRIKEKETTEEKAGVIKSYFDV